jgi:lysophospholipase L1-like esterase
MLLAAFALTALEGRTINIVPIGDSITQGGKVGREEYTYRYPLYYMLREAGYEVDFIGSLEKGLQPEASWPEKDGVPFDPDHEGVYGIRTVPALERLPAAMEKWEKVPDIALIHLGTNDQASVNENPANARKDVAEPLAEMIGLLRAKNPEIVVCVAHLHFNAGASLKIREAVEAMAGELSTGTSPVLTVDMWKGFQPNPEARGADTFDWAHPNPAGQLKMARKWFAAMQPYLDALGET